jgi:hypothetical protein
MADAGLWRRIERYAAADDPLTGASNRLALIVASNQPFYPLYVWWATGAAHTLLALTFLSTPFFLASPWIARRFPEIGRLWFPAVGALNTLFCALIFGEASGILLFLLPCLVIAVLSCSPPQWRALAVCVAGVALSLALLRNGFGTPPYPSTPAQEASLFALNAYSAATLSVIAAWMLYGPRKDRSGAGARRGVTRDGGDSADEGAPDHVESGHENRPVT